MIRREGATVEKERPRIVTKHHKKGKKRNPGQLLNTKEKHHGAYLHSEERFLDAGAEQRAKVLVEGIVNQFAGLMHALAKLRNVLQKEK